MMFRALEVLLAMGDVTAPLTVLRPSISFRF